MTTVDLAPNSPGAGLLEEYLSDEELAAELGVSTRTLHRWRRLGMAPAVTRIGIRTKTHRDDAREWLQSLKDRA